MASWPLATTAQAILNIIGTLNLTGGSTLRLELGGSAPGNGEKFYDQVNMTTSLAAINASFAQLDVSLVNGFKPKPTEVFYILTRADSAAFGSPQPFQDYPEGAKINLGDGWTRHGDLSRELEGHSNDQQSDRRQ